MAMETNFKKCMLEILKYLQIGWYIICLEFFTVKRVKISLTIV